MKKLLSVLLAVTISASISVAYADVAIYGSRNNKDNQVGSYANNSDMPAFRLGDEITFDLSNLAVGNTVTVCSAKCDTSGGMIIDSENIVYINEYLLTAIPKSFTFVVTDAIYNRGTGVYCMKINDGTNTIATFYYKLGDIELYMGTRSGLVDGSATGYNIQPTGDGKWQVGFIGTAKFDMSEANLADFGFNLGFEITNGTNSTKVQLTGDALNSLQEMFSDSKYEIDGITSFVYGTTVFNVPESVKDTLEATAIID